MGNKLEAVSSKKKPNESLPTNVVILSEGNRLPMQTIHQWRVNIFNAIADRMCDANLPIVQRAIGMWKWHTGISLPQRHNISILGESAMRMQVKVGDNKEDIDFGIWLYLNEVRMGVRVPQTILGDNPRLSDTISKCFDGEVCSIMKHEPTSMFFDWIFRNNGIADKDVMIDSITDQIKAAMLADAISNVLTHIYMAVMNALVSEGGMAVTPDKGLINAHNKQMVLEVTCEDPETLSRVGQALAGIGIHVNNAYPQSANFVLFLITLETNRQDAVSVGIENVLASMMCEFVLRETNS